MPSRNVWPVSVPVKLMKDQKKLTQTVKFTEKDRQTLRRLDAAIGCPMRVDDQNDRVLRNILESVHKVALKLSDVDAGG